MRQVDQDILDAQLFQPILEELDPIFKAPPESYDTPQDEEKVIFSKDEVNLQEDVKEALEASRGARKILKSMYGDNSSVSVRDDERPLLEAIGRIFGRETNVITFEMYEKCLEILKEQAEVMAKEVL